MLFLEALLKFSAVGLMLALGLLLFRDGRQTRALRFSLPLIIALCFMFMTTGSPSLSISGPLAIPLRLFDSLNTLFIWWLGLAIFDDHFSLGKREWAVTALYVAITVPVRLYYLGFDVYWTYAMNIAASTFSFLLMLHLCYVAIIGHKEDLLEQRRRIRVWFIFTLALVVITAVLAERISIFFGSYEDQTIWVTYILTFPLAAWALLWLARLQPEVLAFDAHAPTAEDQQPLSYQDQTALDALRELMEDKKIFTNHGLTVADLAQEIGLPEHQLRKLINQTMGFRNFSSFLNRYRISDVKNALSNPQNARTPILTLAIDSGFSSLAPFNRAFKASEGITPSEYRANTLQKSPANPVQN